jgi:sterol desaturase/sphingolipid hydroxylase (fatty acid hydroxylase superfamily)
MLSNVALLPTLLWFVGGLLNATFVEYWSHRLMHAGWLIPRTHARHHQRRWGQGVLGEFRDYVLPSLPFGFAGFLVSFEAGVALVSATIVYCAFAAWSHQVQHEMPERVFWMRQPTHAVHHYHNDWHHNFGITTSLWDRVFGTHRAHPPLPAMGGENPSLLRVHWASPSAPMPKKPRRSAVVRQPDDVVRRAG